MPLKRLEQPKLRHTRGRGPTEDCANIARASEPFYYGAYSSTCATSNMPNIDHNVQYRTRIFYIYRQRTAIYMRIMRPRRSFDFLANKARRFVLTVTAYCTKRVTRRDILLIVISVYRIAHTGTVQLQEPWLGSRSRQRCAHLLLSMCDATYVRLSLLTIMDRAVGTHPA